MLTKNYRRMVNQLIFSSSGAIVIKDIDNVDRQFTWNEPSFRGALASYFNTYNKEYLTSSSNYGLTFVFGNGETKATSDDYYLENEIDDSLFVRKTASKDVKNANIDNVITLIQTVEYTGNSETTIKEFAILAKTSSSPTPWIWAREVLESPITVNTGDIFTVSTVIG